MPKTFWRKVKEPGMLMLVEQEPVIQGEERSYRSLDEIQRIRDAYNEPGFLASVAGAGDAEFTDMVARVQEMKDRDELLAEVRDKIVSVLETAVLVPAGDPGVAPAHLDQ